MWIDRIIILFRLYIPDLSKFISSEKLFKEAVKYGLYDDTEEDNDYFYDTLDNDVDEGRIIHKIDKNGNKTWKFKLNLNHPW